MEVKSIQLMFLLHFFTSMYCLSAHLCTSEESTASQTRSPPLSSPTPVPPCFSLNQSWHHHGGTQGPPHLLPITPSQAPPRKRLQTIMKFNLRPRENKAEIRFATSESGEVWMCMTLCFKWIHHWGLEILSDAGLWMWKCKILRHSKWGLNEKQLNKKKLEEYDGVCCCQWICVRINRTVSHWLAFELWGCSLQSTWETRKIQRSKMKWHKLLFHICCCFWFRIIILLSSQIYPEPKEIRTEPFKKKTFQLQQMEEDLCLIQRTD